jgi:hypothetical protein
VTLTASKFFSATPAELDPETEDKFFCAIRTSNRTTKQTASGRFKSLNDKLLARIKGSRIDEVLDVGISSGVTTIDLVEALRGIGAAPLVTATDRWSHGVLVPVGWNCAALLGEDGEVLQLDLFGRAMRSWSRRLDYLTGMALIRYAATAAIGARARRIKQDSPGTCRRVELVTSRLRANPRISLTEDDVLVFNPRFAGRFDLIRAANILNKGYFTPIRLAAALSNLAAYLRGPGAWLLLNRTHPDGKNHGTLFRLDDEGRLRPTDRFGAGSEIEALALGLGDARR